MARLPKPLRWLLIIALGLFALLVAAVLIGERLINTPTIRVQLTEQLSRVVSGHVSWETLEIRMLPQPHAEIRGVQLALSDAFTLNVGMAQVRLRLFPLLGGHVKVSAITLERPNGDLWIASTAKAGPGKESSQSTIPMVLYRNAMRPVLDALARFAPAATVVVDDGRVTVHLSGLQPLEAREIHAQVMTDGEGIGLTASAAGTYWGRIVINGRAEFADLRALVKVKASQLKLQPALEGTFSNVRQSLVLSEADAELEAATDGHTDIKVALNLDLPKADIQVRARQFAIEPVRIVGSVKFIEGNIAVALGKIQFGELVNVATVNLELSGGQHLPELNITLAEVDLARVRDALVLLVDGQPRVSEYIARVHAGRLRDIRLSSRAESLVKIFSLPNLRGSAQLVDGSVSVPTLEREATNVTASAELADGVIRVDKLSARLGASQLRDAGANVVLLGPMRIEHGWGRATIVPQDLLPDMRARQPFAKPLQSVPTVTGSADVIVRGAGLRFDKPHRVTYDLSVRPRRLHIDTDKLPGTLEVRGGAVRITPKSISADRLSIEVLDSRGVVSGELTHFPGDDLQATARVENALIAPKCIDWIWLRAKLPTRLKPAKALNFSAQRVRWSKAGIEALANANIDSGLSAGVELSMRGNNFTLRNALIKDRGSDANISFSMHDSLIQVGYGGVLSGSSLASVFGLPAESLPGRISGDVQATLDLTLRGRSAARGVLTGDNVDLQRWTGAPLRLERFDVKGDGQTLHIRELAIQWAEQSARIRGEVAREASGFAANLDIESPGIVIDALHSPAATETKRTSASGTEERKLGSSFSLWSLPVTGTVSLRTAFVEARRHRVQDLRAVATLQHETLSVDVAQASLCGVSFPLSLRLTRKQVEAAVDVSASNQSLEGVVQCLTGMPVVMTGNFDIAGTLKAQGAPEEISKSWAKHLAGTVAFSARDGEIRKMALLGNILALKSVSDLLKGDVDLGEHGFKYHTITVGTKIADGQVAVEQAILDSPALGLAAEGIVNLENYESRLTVLVAPFGKLDRMVRKIPILGYVIGGALTSIPVGVSDDIRNPLVVPLGPRAVGSEVLGVFERTFKLPGKLVEPLSAVPGN
ncbi:MAG: AsmA-like C-terminal domain-containing protein [Proteobacteria bacterium]|nr:AsmA-like C-terminal domain-containing protein [Pseudomonadota bacterium]